MPMYFFRFKREDGEIFEEHGAEFINDKNACVEAMRTAREMAAEKVINGVDIDGIYFEITRPDGSLTDKISLKSLV